MEGVTLTSNCRPSLISRDCPAMVTRDWYVKLQFIHTTVCEITVFTYDASLSLANIVTHFCV